MGYTRLIRMTDNKNERYQLAIVANFAEMNYSVAVIAFNHTRTRLESHLVETFSTIFEATRVFNQHIAKWQSCPKHYQKMFETAKDKSRLYV